MPNKRRTPKYPTTKKRTPSPSVGVQRKKGPTPNPNKKRTPPPMMDPRPIPSLPKMPPIPGTAPPNIIRRKPIRPKRPNTAAEIRKAKAAIKKTSRTVRQGLAKGKGKAKKKSPTRGKKRQTY